MIGLFRQTLDDSLLTICAAFQLWHMQSEWNSSDFLRMNCFSRNYIYIVCHTNNLLHTDTLRIPHVPLLGTIQGHSSIWFLAARKYTLNHPDRASSMDSLKSHLADGFKHTRTMSKRVEIATTVTQPSFQSADSINILLWITRN